VVTRA